MSSGGPMVEIVEVDLFDDAQLAAWHAAYWRTWKADLGDIAGVFTLPELIVEMRVETSAVQLAGIAAVVDAGQGPEVVGTGFIGLPMLDNTTTASILLDVVPEQRRRGIGSRLLADLEERARAAGRTLVDAMSIWPHDLGTDGAGWPGVEFARHHGYPLVLSDVGRALDLPVPPSRLEALAAEAAERHAGYRLHSWVGPVPDELAEAWLGLSVTLMTEAPTGDREREAHRPDVGELRLREAAMAAQGRTRLHTVAFAPDGALAGITDLITRAHEPGVARQWGTLVHRDHRGHRLGLALKVANLAQLQACDPDIRRITTDNAEVNQHMIAVNEALGFRPASRSGEFQKRLTGEAS